MCYSSCNDPDKIHEYFEYNDQCDPYNKCHNDIDTWWRDIPKDKNGVIDFLSTIAVNPTIDLGYRVNNTEVSGCAPCFCPFSKQYV